jgi:fatty-acyl-CoA synthase
MNNFDWFSKWNIYSPNSIAVTDFDNGKSYTYSELNHLSNQLAEYFSTEFKLGLGDRVAVLAENCIEYVVLFGVAQKLGIILIPLNYRLASQELNYIIQNSEPTLIIVQNDFLDKAKQTAGFGNVKFKLTLDELSKLQNKLSEQQKSEDIECEEITEDSPIFILYTSGTTAFPKGALYTHKMLFWNSINTELRLNITSDDKSINCAPPFHTGGWNVLFTPFLHHGSHTILMKNFDPELILKIMDDEDVTLRWAVPTMLKMITETDLFKKAVMKKLRYLIVGGEALPLEVINTWHNKGVPIRQGYGLTEVGPNVTSLNQEDATRKLGSIGTPNFYIQTKIVDESGMQILGEGKGEFLLKGPNVTPGYWKNESDTNATINNGWFSTGDVVMRDAEGFLYVVDRLKNMYISGGENVYPAEVEHLLRQHQEIDDVAIIGVPDEKWGEAGKAFIVRTKNSELSEDGIKNYCLEKLAKYKIPKHIKFLEALPTNDSGKIDRKSLKNIE